MVTKAAMSNTVLYLGTAEIASLALDPALARDAIQRAFAAHHAGRTLSKPKLALDLGPGHLFQAMIAASPDLGMAAVKWLGMAPVQGSGGANIDALIALNDLASGRLLAILDGNIITGIRTAAMSAAAAAALARPDSATIGFIGSGVQARAHLAAMSSLLPSLKRVIAFDSGRDSTRRFAGHAAERGFDVAISDDAEALVRGSDIVVTSVPTRPGFRPFLDPAWIRPGAFVTSVDVGRSWYSEGMRALDIVAIDDNLQQSENLPIWPDFGPMGSFDADLSELCAGARPGRTEPAQRTMFVFRGFALADLALAACVYNAALGARAGNTLPR
ncbi:ornithine cyclodeaminase [Bosea sp. BK604]|nr:ornithine cyclodeaminase [Bosea sp. BK604]